MLDDREYLTPPYIEAKKAFECNLCSEEILEGDVYYEIDGLEYCEDCVEEKIAEAEDIEGYIADLE